MFDDAKARAHALGFPTFSAYVVQLLREDLRSRGSLVLREDESAPPALQPPQKVNYRDKIAKKNPKPKKSKS